MEPIHIDKSSYSNINNMKNINSNHYLKRESMNDDELTKMREKLETMSPEKIINEILKNSKKSIIAKDQSNINSTLNSERKDVFLENLKASSISIFLESIKNRNSKEIRSEFEKRLEDHNISTKLYRDKKDKELIEFINQTDVYKVMIQNLEIAKAQLNEKNKKLEEDKKEKEDSIYKLQTKFFIFEKLKPTFEEFFKEYPDEDPKIIIEDIKRKREAAVRIMEDMNELRDKLFIAKKDKAEIFEKNRKVIEDLSEKLSQAELISKDKVERYADEIHSLKNELINLRIFKEENIKLQKMLFNIYNKLVERVSLDRNINLNPALKVIEKDFKPDLLDNDEIAQYIKIMIVDSHGDTCGKMLRETIAYANMMTRTHLRSKINKRFDPVSIFIEIKELLDKTKDSIKEHEKVRDLMKEKVLKFEIETKKMEREAKYKQIQFENLEKKFEEQFNKKIEQSRKIRNSLKKKNMRDRHKFGMRSSEKGENWGRDESKCYSVDEIDSDSDKSRDRNRNRDNSKEKEEEMEEEKEEEKDIYKYNLQRDLISEESIIKEKVDKDFNKIKQRAKSAHPLKNIKQAIKKQADFIGKNNNNKNEDVEIYLTKKKLGKHIKNNDTNREIKSATTRPNTGQLVYQRPRTSVKLFKYSRQEIELTTERNITSNEIINLPYKAPHINKGILSKTTNFKQLNFPKNKDKLTRPGYQTQPLQSEGFGALVEHTNKMFLYKLKMNPSTETNIFRKFQSNMDNNFKKLEKIKKGLECKDNEIGSKILSNLNGMIKNLEKNE